MVMQRLDGEVAAKMLDVFGLNLSNIVTGVIAHAGGGQGSATTISALVSSVDTVATAADSVALPLAKHAGEVHILYNSTANLMQVFGSGTDTINGVATGTGVAQAGGKIALYIAMGTGAGTNWLRLLSA
jgi:hypothetical protein